MQILRSSRSAGGWMQEIARQLHYSRGAQCKCQLNATPPAPRATALSQQSFFCLALPCLLLYARARPLCVCLCGWNARARGRVHVWV